MRGGGARRQRRVNAAASGGDHAGVTHKRVPELDLTWALHVKTTRGTGNSIAGSARCGGGQTRAGNGEGWLGGVVLLR